jgi:uncharacterized damage-inducible protein DinB
LTAAGAEHSLAAVNPGLQQQLDRLERQRHDLLARVEGMDDALLNRSPGDGQWSVIQVFCHLATAEEVSLAGIRKRVQEPEKLARAGLVSRMKSVLLAVALRSGLRFTAPARTVEQLPDERSLADTRAHWDGVRGEWRELIASTPADVADKEVFKHPRVGLLNLDQALKFMAEHVRHHTPQVERILAAVGSAAA